MKKLQAGEASASNNVVVEKESSYRELISKSEKEIQSEELDLKVQQSKSQLEIDIATSKRDLAVAKKELMQTKAAIPYDVAAELKAYNKVKGLELGLVYAEEVLATRF